VSDLQTEFQADQPRVRVGVIAEQTALGSRPDPDQERMLAALELAFPVRFDLADPTDLRGIDGVLVLGPERVAQISAGPPRLVLPFGRRRSDSPTQTSGGDGSVASEELTPVVLAAESILARPLRGRVISESAVAEELPLAPAGATVLAGARSKPVWWQIGDGTARLSVSAYPLAGLRDGETLREHLRAGRFMRLLPLVHFLGQILGDDGWRLPPLRASFVVDDPNLHWPSYGFLKYGELAAHAVRHGYHLGLATVPLDGWLVNRRVASLFRKHASVLSLLIHGNDHVAGELGRLNTDAGAERAIAQALRRIAALERRSGLSVNRVMAPPHAACSEQALRAMFRLGIEAACIGRPYPWRDGLPASTPLAGWHPAELVAGGLPVLPRYPLKASREDLALRALLGQPLIVYGHHGDFAQGLDILAQAASEIDSLGDVQWGPLGWIARRNYATRLVGETLLVKMYSRRIAVDVPTGASELRILVGEPLGGATGHRLTHAGGSLDIAFAGGSGASQPLSVAAPARIELTLAADRPLSPVEIHPPGIRPWPWIRRALVEGRDRVQALR
jgi:hypothetical protein